MARPYPAFTWALTFFTRPPKLLCPYPATVLSQLFGYQPTPCTANHVVLHKSAKQNYVSIDKQLDKKNEKNLEYINTKDVGL